jgi:predicted Zn-dependent protease
MLQKMTQSGSADSFTWYALAMEYRNAENTEAALEAFSSLRAAFPDYLPQYLMAAQLHLKAGNAAEALPWLKAGIQLASASGDQKALGELESALEEAESL